ncbi:hypothetical protein MNBD_GAMMA01-1628 [hydrothermal vent metagenome]|uniref:Uncharacterized protein n=1 Tax=hydrothermal vent metagenome TaxID=652676 RepID=A0A3B0V2R9_9ZZZZ
MKTRRILVYILFITGVLAGMPVVAGESDPKSNINTPNNIKQLSIHLEADSYHTHTSYDSTQVQNQISLSINKNDWISTKIIKPYAVDTRPNYSITANHNIAFGKEISFAWNLSNFLSINLDIFENQLQNNFPTDYLSANNQHSSYKAFNKLTTQSNQFNNNRNLTGYKLGIASELGLGNNYKLGINFDYGQLDGAELAGFNSNEVVTTSFALGIRKAKFGASLNTDVYLEDNVELTDYSRFGFELDWHFSDETTISVGSKQRINNNSAYDNQSNSMDSLIGNVQYIKFQHNL